MVAVALIALAACDDTSPTTPGTTRFGQVGVVEVRLVTPLTSESGRLEQEITWTSRGDWTLREEIFYRGLAGDATETSSTNGSGIAAGVYAQWISQVNEAPGLDLFVDGLDPDLDPVCPQSQTRVTVRITDDQRDETAAWTRCAPGSLSNLTPTGSGPDAAAARVVNAASLARDFTVGTGFLSAYRGSLPFGSLARGEDAPQVFSQPVVFETEAEYLDYWNALSPEVAPEVDFDTEVVILAAVGVREEAGDSVEVRRIVPVETGTLIDVVQRVPGNFCSPASRRQAPYHLVVAPRLSDPIRFAELRIERVPCG